MTLSNNKLTFKVFRGDTLLHQESLGQSVIKIGNLSSSHLRLEDKSVSRMHAVIEVVGDQVSIIDLGSTAGTLVNGHKVNKGVLNSGDTITIGELRVEVDFPAFAAERGAPLVSLPPPVPSASTLPLALPVASARAAPFYEVSEIGGAPAVEVTAMLGDSVVGLKHVMNPRGGKLTPLTYTLLGLGALLLLVSAIAFASGVNTAADNKARFHEHVGAKKVAHEFRPLRLGQGFDWMAVGGLAGGLFLMTTGLMRIREEKVAPSFRIGNAPGVDFPTQDSPLPDFSLVAPQGDDFILHFSPSWQGEMLQQNGQVNTLAELVTQGRARPSREAAGTMELDIQAGAQIRVCTGAQSFVVRSVQKPKRQATPLFASFDSQALSYVAATAVLIGGFMLLLDTLHEDDKTLYGDLFADEGRLAYTQVKPYEDAIQEELEAESDAADPGGTGTKMSEEEGKMGDKNSTRPTGLFAMKNRDTAPAIAKSMAVKQAQEAGILGILKSSQGGAFAAINATADFSSGLDDRDIYGGLTGSEVAEASGGWGFGTRGMGPGGGCIGCGNWGTVGTGNYDKVGHGDGTGASFAAGGGKGGMRGHKSTLPIATIGKVSKSGGIDADIIRRHVKRKLSRIRHCYEKELLARPDLHGTVDTQFQISPAGQVQGVVAKGMGSQEVESCVAGVIKSIQFPKPLDGGYVNVTRYPFTFRPAGE